MNTLLGRVDNSANEPPLPAPPPLRALPCGGGGCLNCKQPLGWQPCPFSRQSARKPLLCCRRDGRHESVLPIGQLFKFESFAGIDAQVLQQIAFERELSLAGCGHNGGHGAGFGCIK